MFRIVTMGKYEGKKKIRRWLFKVLICKESERAQKVPQRQF